MRSTIRVEEGGAEVEPKKDRVVGGTGGASSLREARG